MQDLINKNMVKYETNISKYACKDSNALRFKDIISDFRPPFYRDIDKIIYSLSYSRYIDKTQVFSNEDNDMISKRIIHVQMVSKIARTIGRALNLNEDLIEAASLGHDLGHVPYGHLGESILNEISLKNNEGYFNHNVQSVRLLMNVENKGKGNNITLQVLDAILCHNGEVLSQKYEYENKTKEEFLNKYKSTYTNPLTLKQIKPMTLEGCVLRISDIIAYIGKDIEDAIRLHKIKREAIPQNIVNELGSTNSDIVNSLIVDIIKNSINKPYIKLSKEKFNALKDLFDFNYKNIYYKSSTEEFRQQLKEKFYKLFEVYKNQLECKEKEEDIYTIFIKNMDKNYLENNTNERIIIDYISGMTDNFFESQCDKYLKNSF